MNEEKEQKKREKEEQKRKQREEKERLKADRKERKERKRQEKEQALEEMQELPDIEAEEDARELKCEPVFNPSKVEEGVLIPYECEEEPEEQPPILEEPLTILEEEAQKRTRKAGSPGCATVSHKAASILWLPYPGPCHHAASMTPSGKRWRKY